MCRICAIKKSWCTLNPFIQEESCPDIPLLDSLSVFLYLMGSFYASSNVIETLVSLSIKCIANKKTSLSSSKWAKTRLLDGKFGSVDQYFQLKQEKGKSIPNIIIITDAEREI
jgi:hypothetical protein